MIKKRLALLSGGVLVTLLLVVLVGVSVVSAQEPTPPASPEEHGGPGFFGRRGGFFGARGGSWTMFDTAADALGLTPVELFTELHDGKSLEDVAEAQGVDLEDVQDTIQAAGLEARKEAIEQAVEDGKLSQEQADWMLEGMEKGFFPGGRGFRGGGFGRFGHGRAFSFETDDV